ncbi:hypothetical protein BTN33_21165 [Aeromonas veronii]|uniref:hypothetical protein n=1 Tax=Aeromonas veronii TaxID=654 RepID=UPI0009470FAB|nr:hypothetical protein [Aeromonas veronii]OLF57039.1 hypothetical protein BTN33_21165 [Aeromonas veronii]
MYGRVSLLMTMLLLIGILLGFFISYPLLNYNDGMAEIIRQGVSSIPSWFGAIAGIFGSTFLSYFYAIEKQQKDDRKKEHEQNIKSVNQALIVVNSCVEQLKAIKDLHVRHIQESEDITRSLSLVYSFYGHHPKESVDVASLSFIFRDTDRRHDADTVSPIYIKASVGQYNDILEIIKEKNLLGKKISESLFKSDKTERQGLSIEIEPTDLYGTDLFYDVINFIKTSEYIFTVIDESIDHLSSILTQLPIEVQKYVKASGFDSKVFSVEHDSSIFIKTKKLDVDKEIHSFIERCRLSHTGFNIREIKY